MSLSVRVKEMEIGVFGGSLAPAASSKTINYHFGQKEHRQVCGWGSPIAAVRGTVILLRGDCDIGPAEPWPPGPSLFGGRSLHCDSPTCSPFATSWVPAVLRSTGSQGEAPAHSHVHHSMIS